MSDPLAEALESINQIQDPVTGDTVGGVTVRYDSAITISHLQLVPLATHPRLKLGAARFGLDDVPLGVGDVLQIYNGPGHKF